MIIQAVLLCPYFYAFERISNRSICIYPLAQLNDLRLIAGEINVFRTYQQFQDVKVIGQLPIILIRNYIGR